MIQLWQRYFLREIIKVFFFFLFGFFFLYSLIEYSMHMDDFFKDKDLRIPEIVLYYINQFLKRLDFLMPMALLLSTIKVLTSLNIRNEWIVLQVAGISTRKLLRPFLFVALICSFLTYANFESWLPVALRRIDDFRITHFHSSHLAQRRELIHLIPLKDHSKLLYQSYNAQKNALFDVLWIKSLDEIWRIKYLDANPAHPMAEYVDHIVRNSEGILEKAESYSQLFLSELKWHPRMAQQGLVPFEQRSMSELYRLLKRAHGSPYEIPKISTALAFKVAIPCISPLLVVALAPFCLTYSRKKTFFTLYALGLFGLFACYMLLDSLTILSENGVISPILAVCLPLVILASFFGWRFGVKTA